MEENKDVLLSEQQMITILDTIYAKAIDGVPKVSKSVDDLASSYLKKYKTPEEAARSLIKYQLAKCGTSGFLTGLGGLVTLPVALPANITSVLYVQMRMIAAIAQIGEFDINSDQVQTLVYACLTGSAMADILKQTGIRVGEKITLSAIKSILGKVLTAINQKVGFRLFTKFGEKGVVNFVKLVPLAGGVIGGTVDIGATKIIAENAYNIFIRKEIPEEDEKPDIRDTVSEKASTLKKSVGEGVGKAVEKVKGINASAMKLPTPKLPKVKGKKEDIQKTERVSIPDRIREYKKLADEGIITLEEFEIKKKKLLDMDEGSSVN